MSEVNYTTDLILAFTGEFETKFGTAGYAVIDSFLRAVKNTKAVVGISYYLNKDQYLAGKEPLLTIKKNIIINNLINNSFYTAVKELEEFASAEYEYKETQQ